MTLANVPPPAFDTTRYPLSLATQLLIQALADDIATWQEEAVRYRLLWQDSYTAYVELAQEHARLKARYRELLEEQRRYLRQAVSS